MWKASRQAISLAISLPSFFAKSLDIMLEVVHPTVVMPRYKVECRGCKASWFVVKRRKLEPEQKKQLVWRSRCRPCGVELSAPVMFERTGELFYSARHKQEFDAYVIALKSGETRYTFGGPKTYEQIGREEHAKDLHALATEMYAIKHTKELLWKCAARVEAFKAAGLELEPFRPSMLPLRDEQVREWAGYKFCGACWNLRHSQCKHSGCQCPHVVEEDTE